MRELKAKIPAVAAARFPVVVEGRVGHRQGADRRDDPRGRKPRGRTVFVPVNCAALSDELFESELFGHAPGAFAGAAQDRKGLLKLSSGGTVFVDEVVPLFRTTG